MSKQRVIVVDVDNENLYNNRLFNRSISCQISHTYEPICYLYDVVSKYNIEMITADVYFSRNVENDDKKYYLISILQSKFTSKLLVDKNIVPLILLCQESAFIATKFYIFLKKISSQYKHTFVFAGMMSQVSKKTTYHQMFFPVSFDISTFFSQRFLDKKFITIISSNKQVNNWQKSFFIKVLYGLCIKQIYKERIRVIEFFVKSEDFDLFGRGWDGNDDSIKSIYKGAPNNKHKTIEKYKFAFAYENAIFPGYVTEKIFDVMFAGSVPIYLGAPDITDYVPKECFIDYRDFDTYDELYYFLKNIDKLMYQTYIDNIRRYLHSNLYKKFTQEYFSDQIVSILKKEFDLYE